MQDDDYFALFGLPRRQGLDATDLASRHQAMQAELHPDRHVSSTASARMLAERYIATINEAHRVLADPLERAAYLLRLSGMDPFAEEDRNTMPVDFLETQIELRERMEEAQASDDGQQMSAMIKDLAAGAAAEHELLVATIDGGKDLAPAVDACRRLRYLENCLRELRSGLEKLGQGTAC